MRTTHLVARVLQIVILVSAASTYGQGVWRADSSSEFISRAYFSSSVIDSQIFAIGGAGNDSLQVFDPHSHVWRAPFVRGASLRRSNHTATVINGKIYILGGTTDRGPLDDSLLIFDPSSDSCYNALASGSFTSRSYLASSAVGGKLYAIGGVKIINSKDTVLNTLEVYDPSTNAWSSPLTHGRPSPRMGHVACTVNNMIYVIGGDTDFYQGLTSVIDVFDPATDTWSTLKTIGTFTPRAFLTASVINDEIYVMGGDLGGTTNPSNTLEIFNPKRKSWRLGTSMPTKRSFLSSSSVNGKIYALGGYTPHQELNTVEVFTPGPASVSSQLTEATANSLKNYPNPLSSQTSISISTPRRQFIDVKITDVLGKESAQLFSGNVEAGDHSYEWNASRVPNGVYFCIVRTVSGVAQRALVVQH